MSGKPIHELTNTESKTMKDISKLTTVVLMAAALIAGECSVRGADGSGNWSSFRNGGTSIVGGTLPVEWSPDKGMAWQQETDGYGQSAPIVFDDAVFVTSVIGDMKETCAVTAYQLHSGEQIWQVRIDATQQGPSNYMNSRAAPTPVADLNNVYAFFETGNLVAIDHSGKQLWHRDLAKDLGPFESNHGLGSSLAQTDDAVILNLEHKGPSFLIAINKQDGTTKWRVDRPSGSSWTSPIVTGKSSQIVVSSARSVTGYDASSGEKVWCHEGLEGNSVPSPCPAGGRIIVGARIPEFGSAADAAKSNLSIAVGKSAEVSWRASSAVCDYASPVVDGNQVYFLNKVGVLSCVDTDSGEEIYRERLRAECWATPIVADNGIFFFARDGSVRVVKRGREFDVIATNALWDAGNPPKPETYKEASNAHRHGGSGDDVAGPGGPLRRNGSRPGGRAGGMIAAMMKNDANGDGILEADEISPDFRPMLKRVDVNGDGALDQEELAAMARSFAERRRKSQSSSRDPIVYGIAAVPGRIVIRTGTRLYCVAPDDSLSEKEEYP